MASQITALCVIGALLTLVLKKGAPEIALLLSIALVAAVLLGLMGPFREIVRFLDELAVRSGAARALFVPLYKTVGIALVVRAGGSLCRDAGESALAAAVETVGAVCALLAALPLLQTALDVLMELME